MNNKKKGKRSSKMDLIVFANANHQIKENQIKFRPAVHFSFRITPVRMWLFVFFLMPLVSRVI